MSPIAFALVATALAGQPGASATLSADGQYTLLLQPDKAWSQAEVTVSGDGTTDLGPNGQDQSVRIDGYTSAQGPLWVTVQAVTEREVGLTWMFSVDPESIPVARPVLEVGQRKSKRRRARARRN